MDVINNSIHELLDEDEDFVFSYDSSFTFDDDNDYNENVDFDIQFEWEKNYYWLTEGMTIQITSSGDSGLSEKSKSSSATSKNKSIYKIN